LKKVYIVGVGPGSGGLCVPDAVKAVSACDVLVGGRRNLEAFGDYGKEQVPIGADLDEVAEYVARNAGTKSIAVLVSGDPGIFSIMNLIETRLKGAEVEVIPGISSLQYLCGRIKTAWDDAAFVSVHGRDPGKLPGLLRTCKKVIVFTGGGCKPESVCGLMLENGLSDFTVTVGENLSYPDERVVTGSPQEISGMEFGELSLMLITKNPSNGDGKGAWTHSTHGIPDDMFIRGEVPMTKEEIRAVALSKLRLDTGSTVYDIGAGTGSVSVECALRCPAGRVFAIERNPGALSLITQNSIKFGTANLETIEGEAPLTGARLPAPDRVFIGGSGGNLRGILEWISGIPGKRRVVISSLTLETTYEAVKLLTELGFSDPEIAEIAVARSKSAGGRHMMQSVNPVTVICAQK